MRARILVVDVATGHERRIADATEAVWSPDGRWVAVPVRGGLSVMHADGTAIRQLTHDAVGDHDPVWSPDGAQIAYLRQRVLSPYSWSDDLMIVDVKTGNIREITHDATIKSNLSWLPGGRLFAFAGRFGRTVVIDAATGAAVASWPPPNYPIWSPNGRFVAYYKVPPGRHTTYELHIARVDGSDDRVLVRSGWDLEISDAAWSPDSRSIAFVDGGWSLERVAVRTGHITRVATGLEQCASVWAQAGRACHRVRYRYSQPSWSSDDRRIAFVRWSRAGQEVIAIVGSTGGRTHVLRVSGERPVWQPRPSRKD